MKKKVNQVRQRLILEQWQKEIPNLRAERVLLEARQKEIVDNFRLRRFGRMLLDAMQQEADENKVEKEKDHFKQAMWSKVNSWLTEIDRRPVEERKREDDDDQNNDGLF